MEKGILKILKVTNGFVVVVDGTVPRLAIAADEKELFNTVGSTLQNVYPKNVGKEVKIEFIIKNNEKQS